MMDYDDMIRVLPPADPVVGGNARIDTKEKKEEEEMKKLTASLLSAALVASLAVSVSAFASGTGDPADASYDYPYTETTLSAPSFQEGLPATKAADGDNDTHWHTAWDTDLSGSPESRYIQLTLNEAVELNGLRYLPRQGSEQGNENGRVTQYRVEVSTTGGEESSAWTEVAEGTWESNTAWKIAKFKTPTRAQYVRLYGVTTVSDSGTANAFMSCAELRVQTTQEQEENIFLNKTASASSENTDLSGHKEQASYANDGDLGTKWCASGASGGKPSPDDPMGTHWWQVDLGWNHTVETVNLTFERAPDAGTSWEYCVMVSENGTFESPEAGAVQTTSAGTATVNVNQTGRYVRVYINCPSSGLWPCLKEVTATGSSLDVTPDLEALVEEADSKRAEWYKSGWDAYAQAIATAKEVLAGDAPAADALANAKQAIETAKGNLVEREQYTADDPFVFPGQGETATLEAEFAILKNTGEGEAWPLQIAKADWASHGEFINCLNQQDTITFYYNAPVAGTYSVKAFYRSGSTSNKLAWSGDHIAEGSVEAGASAATETKTVTFDLTITEAGAGTLVFTGPDTKSPQLDKLEITLTKAAYSVTVNSATGGTAQANVTTAAADDTVTLTATPDTGYHFKEWQVQDGTVTITENKFTMPQGNVTITPVFEAHTYGEPTFAWTDDNTSATATFTCACGDEHEETAVITHEVKTPATCTEKGTTTYTATVTVDFGEGTYTSTKDVQDIPTVAHTTELQNAKEATCTTDGYTGDLVCTVCGTVVEEGETIKATGHTQETIPGKEATCTQDGLTDGVKCSVCGEILVEQEVIKATGHKFEDGVCTVCGEKDPNYVPPTQEPQGDVVLDNQTGDQITAGNADEVFEANTIITVVRVEDGGTYAAVEQALKGVVADMKHTAILDITATLSGKPVQPSAPVQMTFAIPQHLSADNLKLFYVSDDGKTTQEIPITVDKDARTVTATIAHFSTYVLANVVVDETTGTVPPTGDASQLMLMTGMLLTSAAALGGLVVASRKRRG